MSLVSAETEANESNEKAHELTIRGPDKSADETTTPKSCKVDEKTEYQELCNVERELDAEIEKMKAQLEAGPSMKETMARLHEYNEIKDAAQKVLGAIANMQGVTIASLHKEYNLPIGENWLSMSLLIYSSIQYPVD